MVRPYEGGREIEVSKPSSGAPSHTFKNIVLIVILALLIFGAYSYWPQITNAYESVKNSTSVAIQPIMQILNPQQTIQQYNDIWGSPTVRAGAEQKKVLSVSFLNPVNQTPLNVIAQLTVNTNEDLVLNPQCYLDDNAITTEPSNLNFMKSTFEQHSSIKCANTLGGKDLSIKVETPLTVKSVLTVWTGKGSNLNVLNSEMDHSSAYSLLLTTLNDQPLASGDYPMIVKIKRESSNVVLKRIESLKIATVSPGISLSCPAISGDKGALSKYLVDKNSDTYIAECTISISEDGTLQRSFIESQMDYVVEEEFKTTLA